MANQEKVSLCMICKNEEQYIQSCIRSVRHLVEEVIVVDTGSNDKTKELARGEGAAVYDYIWNNNFADARNYGLEQATGNWILVLDADEVLENVDTAYFASLIVANNVEGYYFNIASYVAAGEEFMEDQVVRLFRNNPRYRFSGVIHEQVVGSIKEANNGGGIAVADITISHFGYLDKQIVAKDKHARNIGIIKKTLQNTPHDPFLLYSLGIEYMQNGQIRESVGQLEQALRLLHGSEGYFRNVLILLGIGLLRLNELRKLDDFATKSLQMFPDDKELRLLKKLSRS